MREFPTGDESSAYPVRVVAEAQACDDGLGFVHDGGAGVLPWKDVRHVLAAEVGEPEGISALVVEILIEGEGGRLESVRTSVEGGEPAIRFARGVKRQIPPGRCAKSLDCLAADGAPRQWYPDLTSLEEAVLESLRA